MKDFNFHVPTEVVFGAGQIRRLGDLLSGVGKRVMLVLDPQLDRLGLGGELASMCRKAALGTLTFTGVRPNPVCSDIDQGAQAARQEHCDVIVGVGGGSTIDTAKAIAVVCTGRETAWEHTRVNGPSAAGALPIVAVPTTSGTGSEVTPWSVISNPDERDKRALSHGSLFPRVALIDPELMVSMPKAVTASSGIDALSHSLESFISSYATPCSKLLAKESIRLAARHLPEATANGTNLEARSQMAWASMLGGLAITHARTVVPHAIATAAGALFDAPHGGSIAACLATVLERSYVGSLEVFAELSETLDDSVRSLPLRDRAADCARLVRRLLEDMDYCVRYGDFGITGEDIEAMAAWLVKSSFWEDFKAHPRLFGIEEVKQMLRECV